MMRHLVEIIHAGPAEMPIGDRKACGLDDVGLTSRHAQRRRIVPVFCGMSGWKSAICIRVMALAVPVKCPNKSWLWVELVHCTPASR